MEDTILIQKIDALLKQRFVVFAEHVDKRFEQVDKRFDKLEGSVDLIAQTVAEHEKRFDRILFKLIKHDEQLKKIQENMVTKAEVSEINWKVDELRITVGKVDDELKVQGRWKRKHEERLIRIEQKLFPHSQPA